MIIPSTISSSTRKLSAQQVDLLQSLLPGRRIRITQSLRVGARNWQTTVEGTFCRLNYLATGVTVERLPEDDIIVPIVHFEKGNGELSSIAVDENTIIFALV
jgi:hypothetical protein